MRIVIFFRTKIIVFFILYAVRFVNITEVVTKISFQPYFVTRFLGGFVCELNKIRVIHFKTKIPHV